MSVALVVAIPSLLSLAREAAPGGRSDLAQHEKRRSGRTLRFVALGDFGSGTRKQAALAQKMCRWRRNHPYSLVITTGDNIYPRGAPSDFAAHFIEPYACLLQNGVQFHASLGNHDIQTDNGRPQLDEPLFGMKGRNYILRRHGVRFVIADSNAINRVWLRRATRPRARWKIVVFHHPVYSPGTAHGSTPGFRQWMPALFHRNGVDLVLNGHDHIYAASKPLRGIRYLVTGGGGDKLYGCRKAWFSVRCVTRYHFLYVIARDRKITVKAVSTKAGVFHRFRTTGVR